MRTRLPQSWQSSEGWHSRGYLPHFERGELPQFITFRLHDSLPREVLLRWRKELREGKPGEVESILRRRVEAYLDQGHGACHLKNFGVAKMVQDALLFHDQKKYRLVAWVIMPNHAHMLFTPKTGHSLAEIMHSLKSYTASEANKMLGSSGRFWQKEYFDRYIRHARHYAKVVAYIENNPVKAKLCEQAHHWPFGSASLRVNTDR